jgi:hypothetical protein
MYSVDQLTDVRASSPATAVGSALPEDIYTAGAFVEVPSGSVSFSIMVDGQEEATEISYTLQNMDVDPQVLARNLEITINNVLGTLEDTEATEDTDAVVNARYGITVEFDTDTATFSIASGTTGDDSSISILDADAQAIELLGLEESDNLIVEASEKDALRGKASEPAVLRGEVMTINTSKSIQVTSSNKDFFASVDGIVQQIALPFPTTYTSIDSFAAALEDLINTITDEENGSTVNVSGVKVAFDTKTKQLVFTTGTTGSDSAIQVTGSEVLGLADTEMQFGTTT